MYYNFLGIMLTIEARQRLSLPSAHTHTHACTYTEDNDVYSSCIVVVVMMTMMIQGDIFETQSA